jgi:hypothetical protein
MLRISWKGQKVRKSGAWKRRAVAGAPKVRGTTVRGHGVPTAGEWQGAEVIPIEEPYWRGVHHSRFDMQTGEASVTPLATASSCAAASFELRRDDFRASQRSRGAAAGTCRPSSHCSIVRWALHKGSTLCVADSTVQQKSFCWRVTTCDMMHTRSSLFGA